MAAAISANAKLKVERTSNDNWQRTALTFCTMYTILIPLSYHNINLMLACKRRRTLRFLEFAHTKSEWRDNAMTVKCEIVTIAGCLLQMRRQRRQCSGKLQLSSFPLVFSTAHIRRFVRLYYRESLSTLLFGTRISLSATVVMKIYASRSRSRSWITWWLNNLHFAFFERVMSLLRCGKLFPRS